METQHGKSIRTLRKPFSKLSLARLRSGQGLVEFALAIPIFLVVLFGMIEAGRLLFIYSSVVSASREAARWGAATDHINDCAGIKDAAKRVGGFAGINDQNVGIQYNSALGAFDPDTCQPDPGQCPLSGYDPLAKNRVHVDVTVRYEPIVPLANFSGICIDAQNAQTIIQNVYLPEE